jgi:hypothetical protein
MGPAEAAASGAGNEEIAAAVAALSSSLLFRSECSHQLADIAQKKKHREQMRAQPDAAAGVQGRAGKPMRTAALD